MKIQLVLDILIVSIVILAWLILFIIGFVQENKTTKPKSKNKKERKK